MWGTSPVDYLIYYRLLKHQMHYMTAFPRFTAPGWIWGLGKATAPSPPPPLPTAASWQYEIQHMHKKKSICGVYFLIPLPVITSYKDNQNYLSFLPFCLSSLNQGCPLFLTGFTRIIMNNTEAVQGITFPEHLFVLSSLISQQGSYTFSAVKFKDFSRNFKDHIFKFQGPYLLLLTQVPNKL